MKYLFGKIQQRFDEWRVIRRVSILRKKSLWFSDLSGEGTSLPAIKIEQGYLNHEGRRVLDTAMAEFLMRGAIEEAPFSFYLEKSRWLNNQLGLRGLKKILLNNQYYKRMLSMECNKK